MNFGAFREFRIFRSAKVRLEDVSDYLSNEMVFNLRNLATGLLKLTFDENFESFIWEGTVGATSELAIRHDLGVAPSSKIILRTNNSSIIDGDTENDDNFVYLKNPSGTNAAVKVVFLR